MSEPTDAEWAEARDEFLADAGRFPGVGDSLEEQRAMESGTLDAAELGRRRLDTLRGTDAWQAEDPLRAGLTDLVIEAMAWHMVFEADLASQGQELPPDANTATVRDRLAASVEDLGDSETLAAVARALRLAGEPDPVGDLRRHLDL